MTLIEKSAVARGNALFEQDCTDQMPWYKWIVTKVANCLEEGYEALCSKFAKRHVDVRRIGTTLSSENWSDKQLQLKAVYKHDYDALCTEQRKTVKALSSRVIDRTVLLVKADADQVKLAAQFKLEQTFFDLYGLATAPDEDCNREIANTSAYFRNSFLKEERERRRTFTKEIASNLPQGVNPCAAIVAQYLF